MPQPLQPAAAGLPEAPAAHHLGDLARSDRRWNVYLETRSAGDAVAGRLHFVEGDLRRSTTWIFLESSEADILNRFGDFSPVELWRLVESLVG
ncbi:MAG TPA: hypothetical protein VJ773_10915 [Gemmatimonadales bacterium]|nr:hypothetical protein [Gemmatimonadales bacterium]